MEALHTTVAEAQRCGGTAAAAHCDVMNEDDLVQLVGSTIEQHGQIDVLVNNAGVVTGGRLG
jgi:NAD(P)-dependent dehydrogenase (short-subunit alcohol dehydrogenase family)